MLTWCGRDDDGVAASGTFSFWSFGCPGGRRSGTGNVTVLECCCDRRGMFRWTLGMVTWSTTIFKSVSRTVTFVVAAAARTIPVNPVPAPNSKTIIIVRVEFWIWGRRRPRGSGDFLGSDGSGCPAAANRTTSDEKDGSILLGRSSTIVVDMTGRIKLTSRDGK